MPHFECGAFNRSATSPLKVSARLRRGALHNGWPPDPQGLSWATSPARLDLTWQHRLCAHASGVEPLRAGCILDPDTTDKKTVARLSRTGRTEQRKAKKCSQSSKRAASSIALSPTTS